MKRVKKIPKAVRHSIYIKALEVYRNEIKNSDTRMLIALCYAIDNGVKGCKHLRFVREVMITEFQVNSEYYSYDGVEQYPEIFKHQPKKIPSDRYWFNINDTVKRIAILEEAIALTKPFKIFKHD